MDHTPRKGPLAGVRVLELAGLAPGPFAGMMLADHGAEVLRVERVAAVAAAGDRPRRDVMDRGKRTVGLDLKSPEGVAAFKELAAHADVVIEVFRPGVAERLGIGPDDLHAVNPRLVYGRMTGWGQDGPLAPTAGHDIDYIAISGVLSMLGRAGEKPTPPINILGDFAGGGLMLAYGVLLALIERERTGEGRVVDAAMVDGAATLFAMFYHGVQSGFWGPRGTNLLDTGSPVYDTYETADGGYMAVGALEPRFWAQLVSLMGLTDLPDREDRANWPALRERLAEAFRSRTRAEWEAVFDGTDACVSPVLDMAEAADHPHNRARGTFVEVDGVRQPAPAPRLLGAPGPDLSPATRLADLSSWGLPDETAAKLREAGVLA
ncbi:CaiB/BaiF CoA transferase family protein [Planomonospora parontospora]|uniref:CaiB/BaiF CoA transferase family protein n=1 Tax=Planomonospora parontospora TaxID=58119 RepID=UPI001670E511|nr:CaiB/BaiF CoA-transferase family protein [Planomonospora parontospora]GGL18413.1 CoA transferase [Planomonospora parontospora subsp. antibiotica]GII15560.1 CoA transferase [Planomonospora parontospora subsp. antibiotica]